MIRIIVDKTGGIQEPQWIFTPTNPVCDFLTGTKLPVTDKPDIHGHVI